MSKIHCRNHSCKWLAFAEKWSLGLFFLFISLNLSYAQKGNVVPTNASQKNFLKAYKLAFHSSDKDFRSLVSKGDSVLFRPYGEYSVYWATSGANKGSFVYPDSLPSGYNNNVITSTPYTSTYNWQAENNLSIQYKALPKKVAIFRSKIKINDYSINWEAQNFRSLFETFLENNTYYFINEDQLTKEISDTTSLLIIPAFMGENYYIDSLYKVYPTVGSKIKNFLSKGGTIYAEGNASYFLELAGIFSKGTVNFSNTISSTKDILKLNPAADHPIGYASEPLNNELYASSIPLITNSNISVISSATDDNRPVIFTVTGSNAFGGKIICNLGLPTSGGIAKVEQGSRQLQWTFNALLYAFAQKIDVSRLVINKLSPGIIASPNSVSHDRIDTFDVKIMVRNLSNENISSIQLTEDFRNYFQFLDMSSSTSFSLVNGNLNLNLSLGPKTEQLISFRLRTPDPEDPIHSEVDKFIDYDTYMAASLNKTTYTDSEGTHSYNKTRNYADIMFSARLMGDADVNWKTFGPYFKSFKVFMTLENKERTSAVNTVYTQFIPKDIPFYKCDKDLGIPVVKTPGGTFIDVLKGSADKNHPEYDIDSDGYPDAWLDTASIYPKGYQIKDTLIYWANPWKNLKNGGTKIEYEDIDHDGIAPVDENGDGIMETDDPDDKIRAYKVTWNIGTVGGYEYFDPYCSFEIWMDAPDVVAMAAGVAYAQGKLTKPFEGMYYPYTKDIATANLSDTRWKHWMSEPLTDVQMIKQSINNYNGYAFIDTAAEHYSLKPYDSIIGNVPKPEQAMIAVLSLGGEEIDMTHPTPKQSLYSKLEYNTIFNEHKVMPIRTTYAHTAPLPSVLQFEYLGSTYSLKDSMNNPVTTLPANGKAKVQFDIDASTEYSYYWIRFLGHRVKYNDPSLALDGNAGLGDGVFGYFIYEIPKGIGGYQITLPRRSDGSYDLDAIAKVDGHKYQKWIDYDGGDSIQIWEDPFRYQIYIPQLLIPPALVDKNHDGIDDWRDDTGDRMQSASGYYHDAFMPGDGEWMPGPDGTLGSDNFDQLGKVHFTINANYEGFGREGSIDLSKGGTLVCEEVNGGSPWVVFSHVLSGYAKGVDYRLTSSVSTPKVKYGLDSVIIKHTIEDANEPRFFDIKNDPYHLSIGYKDASLTVLAGGRDPVGAVDPIYETTTLMDPTRDHRTVTLIPLASSNPKLQALGYPKTATGTFMEVKVEVVNTNTSSYDWINTTVKPNLSKAGNSSVVLSYVCYPRPLVPNKGGVIPGDQPGSFTTGWRFNQPEGEMIVQLGDTLNKIQAGRKAYFIFLIKVDETLPKGVYDIDFTFSSTAKDYKGNDYGKLDYEVPSAKFSITPKNAKGYPTEYQKYKIDYGKLNELTVNGSEYFQGAKNIKYSSEDVDYTDFNSITNTLPATSDNNTETINLSKVTNLPNADTSKLYLLEKVIVNSYRGGEDIDLTTGENLRYTYDPYGQFSVPGNKLTISPYGPRILINQKLYSVNGNLVDENYNVDADTGKLYVVTRLDVINVGSDVSENTTISVHPGAVYTVLTDSLKPGVTYSNGLISANLGLIAPGETKYVYIYYSFKDAAQDDDLLTVIKLSDIQYSGASDQQLFKYIDNTVVSNDVKDLKLVSISSQKITNTEYSITVNAKNNGIPVQHAMLRIYEVVGGKVIQNPIAFKEIPLFNTGVTETLQVNYTLPNDLANNEQIQIYAKIDDDDIINEINENNNSELKLLVTVTGIKDLKKNFDVSVYPNPFVEKVTFAYNLDNIADAVNITLYNSKGSAIVMFADCPKNEGLHTINWTPGNMATGNYIYRIEIKNKGEKPSVITGVLIKN
jgi:hypothetical protein